MENKELLFSVTKKDLSIKYFSGKGSGGQHRNKHQNCVRMSHPLSGASVTGQSHKERRSNLKEAINNLVEHPKFKIWQTKVIHEACSGKTIEERVDESMSVVNLKIEGKNKNGKWEKLRLNGSE